MAVDGGAGAGLEVEAQGVQPRRKRVVERGGKRLGRS